MKRKIIQAVILLSILAIFPLISWLYLSNGLDYRKDLLNELKPLGAVPEFTVSSEAGNFTSLEVVAKRVGLIGYFEPNSAGLGEFIRVADQFDGRKDFYSILLDTFPITGADDIARFYRVGSHQDLRWSLDELTENDFSAGSAILIDTAMQVRHFYKLDDPDDVTRLVEHAAVLLPINTKKRMRE